MQRTFLEGYKPGGTFSLPESLRADLHALGRTSPDESKEPSTQAEMVLDALQRLHEGNVVARCRLKLSGFQAWKPMRDRQQTKKRPTTLPMSTHFRSSYRIQQNKATSG